MPHLIKSLRNNLTDSNLSYTFLDKEEEVSWEDLVQFYKMDSSMSIRMAPKLTEGHVKPNNCNKMRVSVAAQVFSNSVSAGMLSMAEQMKEKSENIEKIERIVSTAKFFKRVNDIFDCANSALFNTPVVLRRPVTPDSPHMQCMIEAIQWVKTIKFDKNNSKKKHVIGLQMWLSGVMEMLSFLNDRYNISVVRLSHVNQDPLENWFGQIRSNKGSSNDNPNVIHFSAIAKTLSVKALIKPSWFRLPS